MTTTPAPRVPLFDAILHASGHMLEVRAAIERVVSSQRFILGEEVLGFEREIADWLGASHAIGVCSGSDALLVALLGLEIGPGDEVVTTPFSFFASTGAILRVGARPVFADIDAASFNLSPPATARALSSKTRAILPVHLFGRAAEMAELAALASERQLAIVEDAAQAIGARVGERCVGTLARAGCFSFFPSKNLGAYGDAGLVVTGDATLAERVRSLRSHGFSPKHHSRMLGGNFRLDALQAAILRAKLPHLRSWNERRRAVAERYTELLGPLAERYPGRLTLPGHAGSEHVFNQFVIRSPERARLEAHLRAVGVETARYYPLPIHLHDVCRPLGYVRGDFPEAECAAEEALALPIFAELTPEQLEHVARSVASFLS